MWDSRRIFRDLADADRRQTIFNSFWKHADATSKTMAVTSLSKVMKFRPDSLKKLPLEKKAEFLSSRASVPEFEQLNEMALMQYHTHVKSDLLSAFLDEWKIPHENGTIENDEYATPSTDQVRAAATSLASRFEREDILIYLATAGLLMGEEWRASTWPVVDEMVAAKK